MERIDLKNEEENRNYKITYSVSDDQKACWLHFTFTDENRARTVASFLRNQVKSLPIKVSGIKATEDRITILPSSENNPIGAAFVEENDNKYVDINFGSGQSRGMFQIWMNINNERAIFEIENSENLGEDSIRFNTENIDEDLEFQLPRSKEGFEAKYGSAIPSREVLENQRGEEGLRAKYGSYIPTSEDILSPKAKKIVDEIDLKLAELRKSGEVNNLGEWSDDVLRQKHQVLILTRSYLTNPQFDVKKLSMAIDHSPEYGKKRYFAKSDTARLVNETEALKGAIPPVRSFYPAAQNIPDSDPVDLYPTSPIEVGTSGYIYIDGRIHGKSSVLYSDQGKAKDAVDLALKIIQKIKQIHKDGGYNGNEWTDDSNNKYRDKNKVLSFALMHLLGETSLAQLSMMADQHPQYKQGIGWSNTEGMVKDVLSLRGMKNDLKVNEHLKVNEKFYNENKDDTDLFSSQRKMLVQGYTNAGYLKFHHDVNIRVGESGYLYVNDRLLATVNEMYNKEQRKECVTIYNDIQKQITKLKKDGGYRNGYWTKDPDNRYRHKFQLMSTTIGYLMGVVTYDQLSIVGDYCKKYDANWAGEFGRSTSGKLLDRALELKGQKILKPVNSTVMSRVIKAEPRTHDFFKSDIDEIYQSRTKIRKKKNLENLIIDVGSSGYIYLNSLPVPKLKQIYNTEAEAEKCAALCQDIQKELKKLRESAGIDWQDDKQAEKTGIGIFYHKYKVLLKTMEFALNETTPEKLEITLGKYRKYNATRINEATGQKIIQSRTEDLLDRALDLRKTKINKHPSYRRQK